MTNVRFVWSAMSVLPRRLRSPALPATVEIIVDGAPVAIAVRRSERARRYTLKLPAASAHPILVIPAHGSLERGLSFARSQSGWLRERIRRRPDHVDFEDGAEIPLRGETHLVRATGLLRGGVRLVDGEPPMPRIEVAGDAEHLARRLTDWLKVEARRDLEPAVRDHANRLGVRPKRIAIRDQSSRWGSCSTNGTLSFSWRLVLAPPMVLDYLAAHEVAHMVEMNHSRRFWRTLESIAPHTGAAEAWLKRHGASLFRYGPR